MVFDAFLPNTQYSKEWINNSDFNLYLCCRTDERKKLKLINIFGFIWVHVEAYHSYCLLQVMKPGFCLIRCICEIASSSALFSSVKFLRNIVCFLPFLMWNYFLSQDLLPFVVHCIDRNSVNVSLCKTLQKCQRNQCDHYVSDSSFRVFDEYHHRSKGFWQEPYTKNICSIVLIYIVCKVGYRSYNTGI